MLFFGASGDFGPCSSSPAMANTNCIIWVIYTYIHIASYKARAPKTKKKTMVRYGMEWNGMEMLPAAWLHCLQLQVINFTTTRF